MKQTAVEWLIEQIEEKGDVRETPSIRMIQINIDTSDYLELKRKAKAMEREQIEEAYWDGGQDVPVHGKQCERYYNETYKGGKQ